MSIDGGTGNRPGAGQAGAAVPEAELVDVALLGGGGAGLSLLLAIEQAAARRGVAVPRIALIDPVHRTGADRTWCWWQPSGSGSLSGLLHRSWDRMELFDRQARRTEVPLGELRYVMLRSQDLYAEADRAVQRLGVVRIQAAGQLMDEPAPGRVAIQAGDRRVLARWVFDSRPAPPQRAPHTSLLQHFRGWTVRLPAPLLDPQLPTLMDFRVRQPGRAVAFGYCLPLAGDLALVEYTEFGRRRLTSGAYDKALAGYLQQRWQLAPGQYAVEAVEDGVIPMTDAGYDVRAGQRTFRIGTAGGATRGSTGYTLAAAQRQAAAVAHSLLDGHEPVPPAAYPLRHRWMDAVLLRAIDRELVDGPELFTELFSTVPPDRLVRFLDGLSSTADDLAVMRAAPPLAMIRAGAEDAALRAAVRFGPLVAMIGSQSAALIRSVARRY